MENSTNYKHLNLLTDTFNFQHDVQNLCYYGKDTFMREKGAEKIEIF